VLRLLFYGGGDMGLTDGCDSHTRDAIPMMESMTGKVHVFVLWWCEHCAGTAGGLMAWMGGGDWGS